MARLRLLFPLLIAGGLAALPFVFAADSTRFWQGVMIQIFILAIYALSYDVLMGHTGMISFGHALFFGGGGYAAAILLRRADPPPFPLVVLAVVATGAILGAGVGVLSLRLSGVYFSMITLALAEIAFILFKADDPKLKPLTGGEVGIQGLHVPAAIDPTAYRLRFYFLALASMIALYAVARRMVNSPTGRVLAAIRENEGRAVALGYNTFRYKLFATSFSAALAALAGMLQVLYEKSATFEMLGVSMTIQALLMTIIGGIGTLAGPMLGAGTVRLLDQWLKSAMVRGVLPDWLRADLLFGLMYVALVLFFPSGIAGALRKLRGGDAPRRSSKQIKRALEPKAK